MFSLQKVVKKNLTAVISRLITGKTLTKLRQTHSAIIYSRGIWLYVMMAQIRISEQATDFCAQLGPSRLAYAILSHRFLAEDPSVVAIWWYIRGELDLPLFACLYWEEIPSLQLRFPLPLRRKAYKRWWERNGPEHYKKADRILRELAVKSLDHGCVPFCEKPFGVNLIGHASSVFGLGEYLRMIAKALEAAEIPYCVIDIPANNGAQTTDDSLKRKTLSSINERPYAFSIYCLTAETHYQLAIQLALQGYFDIETYSVAIWFWELERWPQRLTEAMALADEYWPCTDLIHKALHGARDIITNSDPCSHLHKPIHTIPPVVDLGNQKSLSSLVEREKVRRLWGLDPDAILFSFSFDLNSRIARKNPQAVINAFQLAFANSFADIPSVGLVIKSFPPRRPEPLWEELKNTASKDTRITIIEDDLDRNSILSLYGCCDCFVSLHRSEGLGLGLAEALQLGLDVIATNYGGNVDFCSGPLAHPVPYHLIPVEAGEYPDHEGMMWAEPDIQQATELMVEVARKRSEQPITSPEVIASYRARFCAKHVGEAMRLRLEHLWQRREEIQNKLPGSPYRPASSKWKPVESETRWQHRQ